MIMGSTDEADEDPLKKKGNHALWDKSFNERDVGMKLCLNEN